MKTASSAVGGHFGTRRMVVPFAALQRQRRPRLTAWGHRDVLNELVLVEQRDAAPWARFAVSSRYLTTVD